MRTTVMIPDGLARQAKAAAAARGQTLSAYVSDSLRAALRAADAGSGKAVTLPTVAGAPLPGVDLYDSATLEDVMSTDS